jgi:hypothetical protein
VAITPQGRCFWLTIDFPGLRLTGRAPTAGLERVLVGRALFVAGLLDDLADVDDFAAGGVRGLADLPAVLGLLGGLRCAIGLVSVLGLVCAASSCREAGVRAILGGRPEGPPAIVCSPQNRRFVRAGHHYD